MAQPTTQHSSMTPQAATQGVTHAAPPGVGMMGAAPPVGPVAAAEPVLLEDIDPVLLVRLYPGARDAAEMRAQALAAGQATFAAGQELIASQQEPVVVLGEPVAPPPKP
jgi:hypothetical protein